MTGKCRYCGRVVELNLTPLTPGDKILGLLFGAASYCPHCSIEGMKPCHLCCCPDRSHVHQAYYHPFPPLDPSVLAEKGGEPT